MPTAAELLREGVWDSLLHPRAEAGSSAGGQFTSGGSGGGRSKGGHAVHVAKASKGGGAKKPRVATKLMAYNPKTNTGPGYNLPHGDPRVHQLQEALNRLGATDAHGRQLIDDGKLGPLTTQAIQAAQTKLGLKPTGRVTPALLNRLVAAKALTPSRKGHPAKAVKVKHPILRARHSVTAAELLLGSGAVSALESWEEDLHPRGEHGRFARSVAKARRHGEREHEVWRQHGKVETAPRGQRKVAELKATARHKQQMEDRVDERLKWGEQTKGHWYMVKGPRYWVKQDDQPGWHHGYYYVPGRWMPVVPPRDTWESPRSYDGIPGQTALSSAVPDDVHAAAGMYKEDRTGRRMVGHGADRTAKSDQFENRKARAGLGSNADLTARSKRLRTRKVKPKTAAEALFGGMLADSVAIHPHGYAGGRR